MSSCLINMLIQFLFLFFFNVGTLMIDFKSPDASDWYIINDGVMGGLSKGNTVGTNEGLLFYGEVSLENNGGFSSIRSPWKAYDLTEYEQVTIRYRSEGIRKAFVMETDRRFYVPNFKVSLPSAENWVSKTFKLQEFKQYRLGNPTGATFQGENKDDIIRLGFITDEKRAGDFRFEVASIKFQ